MILEEDAEWKKRAHKERGGAEEAAARHNNETARRVMDNDADVIRERPARNKKEFFARSVERKCVVSSQISA